MSLTSRIRQAVANVQNGKLTRQQLRALHAHLAAHPMAHALLDDRAAKLLECLRDIRPEMLPR